MKKRVLFLTLAFVIVAVPILALAVPASRQEHWNKVQQAMKKGLPRTAIENLDPIIKAAIKDKAYPEAIKAIAQKISLEGNIQGNKPEEKIVLLKAEIAKAPPEMVPVMDTILANWYWHFFQHNRWRFMQRTATAGPSGDDILTWDLPRIMAEIDRQFTKALANEKVLKTIPIATYGDLLIKGTAPDAYRPTLYDFLAFNALDFYSAGEQGLPRAEDAFELSAESPIFASTEDFLKWNLQATDSGSRFVKAIHLYQALLKFHQNDENKAAYLDADLHRLRFGYNHAFGEVKNPRYKSALSQFAEKWNNQEASAMARFLWAAVLSTENDKVEARKLALEGSNAFPNSIGGKFCYNLVQAIEAREANISSERVWNAPWPNIQVRYRNVTKVYFRVIPFDFEKRIGLNQFRPELLNDKERKAILGQKATQEWSADLPATEDYLTRIEKLPVPKTVPTGSYWLVASHDAGFSAQGNQVTFTPIWVSTLAVVVRTRPGEAVLEGFVLDSQSGNPIPGADVKAWYRTNNNNAVAVPPVKTDANGLFRINGTAGINNQGYLVLAKFQGQALASAHDFYLYQNPDNSRPFGRTVFFTDRSLYRPGQTVQYRGLCVDIDQKQDNYKVIANKVVTVLFNDPNGKEVARNEHQTNEYGSFSGSFTAPIGRVTGQMHLAVKGTPEGNTHFNVEEYKRPKFQVTLEKPTTAAKLGGVVSIPGKALAYSGAAIDSAKVRFRVVREIRYPIWYHWCFWWRPVQNVSQEIAHGHAFTGVDGSFKVEFTALPDPTVSEKDEPTFHFKITADVTDNSGETRSGQQNVNVAFTALKAEMAAESWLTNEKPVTLKIRTTTHDDEPQVAEGTVKIYKLKQPEQVLRPELANPFQNEPVPRPRRGGAKAKGPQMDPANPNSWELGEVVLERGFTTDAKGDAKIEILLNAGPYRALLETRDRFGKKVTALLPMTVVDPTAKKLEIKLANLVAAPKWSVEPGHEFTALWGTGYDQGRAFIEIEHRGKLIQSYWTPAERTQVLVNQAVTEGMRGGFTFRVTYVRENRAYLENRRVDVPWSNKDLAIRWERFVNKLEPGQKVTWTAVITGPQAQKAVAEMVASLYDESLDAYLPHHWLQNLKSFFRQDHARVQSQFENLTLALQHLQGHWAVPHKDTTWTYRTFPQDIIANYWGYQFFGGRGGMLREQAGMAMPAGMPPPAPGLALTDSLAIEGEAKSARSDRDGQNGLRRNLDKAKQESGEIGPQDPSGPNLDNVSARKNLNETAFFFPHLISNKDGEVKLEFTMPEALTRWKFLGFVNDKELRSGYLTDSAVTAKDLMVYPNPPRFLREGDLLEFTVKVVNQSETIQSGTVRLTFNDARTGQPVDPALGNTANEKPFEVPAKESRVFSWRIKVADDLGLLTYKAVAAAAKIADGEEGYLPVLSRRVLVTESLPLPLRGPLTKNFDFARLKNSGNSDTLKHERLTVQVVSNPNWYAVMALPYLMEFPYECSEQTFNRLYANSLARHIANSDPKIRNIFDQWKGTPALDSPLERNRELNQIVLEETPWLRQANKESQARRNVGILFDDNRLNSETARLLQQLAEMQLADGAWPWFPGGRGNDYITLYITTGFGRLRHLGVGLDQAAAIRSLNRLDGWIDQIYRQILKHGDKDKNHLSPTIALYLYGRSFFLQDKAIAKQHQEAVDYFLGQAKQYWLQLANRQSQAHLALALKRFGQPEPAEGIMRSIKERAVTNEEMGMFWRDLEISWWWFRAPIETQAMMIEAFQEVMNDQKAVEDCKVWLIKQKQTQDWKTTKATADAVYGLLLRGNRNPLASDALVTIALGGEEIRPEKVEAGTGFYEKTFLRTEIKPAMGEITVKKVDEGVSWASVHWQYLEDMSKVTPYEGTPLTLKKALFTREYTKKGPVLQAVNGALKVGDELVVRVELRVDRDMEYVHLKDYRGSGTEPVNVLSRYRFQDGLAYYESTRDTASHFFIDYLPKGTYVFEYATRVVHRGQYQTGMATIQCMYAPEYNSHSDSQLLVVE